MVDAYQNDSILIPRLQSADSLLGKNESAFVSENLMRRNRRLHENKNQIEQNRNSQETNWKNKMTICPSVLL